ARLIPGRTISASTFEDFSNNVTVQQPGSPNSFSMCCPKSSSSNSPPSVTLRLLSPRFPENAIIWELPRSRAVSSRRRLISFASGHHRRGAAVSNWLSAMCDVDAMRWFRSRARLGSGLALLALVAQLTLSFGHLHADTTARDVGVTAAASNIQPSADQAGTPSD